MASNKTSTSNVKSKGYLSTPSEDLDLIANYDSSDGEIDDVTQAMVDAAMTPVTPALKDGGSQGRAPSKKVRAEKAKTDPAATPAAEHNNGTHGEESEQEARPFPTFINRNTGDEYMVFSDESITEYARNSFLCPGEVIYFDNRREGFACDWPMIRLRIETEIHTSADMEPVSLPGQPRVSPPAMCQYVRTRHMDLIAAVFEELPSGRSKAAFTVLPANYSKDIWVVNMFDARSLISNSSISVTEHRAPKEESHRRKRPASNSDEETRNGKRRAVIDEGNRSEKRRDATADGGACPVQGPIRYHFQGKNTAQ